MSMMWVGIGSAVLDVGGSLISGNSAAKSQQAANATNAKIASDTNAQNWNQYLLSRGINPGNLPGVNSGSVNTVLPLGFTLNGQPAEQAIFNRIMNVSGAGDKFNDPTYAVSADNIASFLSANPQVRADLTAKLADGGDSRTVEQWIHDDATEGDPNFSRLLSEHATQQQQTYQSNLQLPPQYQKLLDYGPKTLDQLYGGNFLAQQQQAQDAINQQRSTLAATVQQGIDEQRAKLGTLNTGNLSDLDRILATATSGSQGIYDASLTQADTYANAVKQATADALQKQRASRALAGFVGNGSGDQLLRARTLAGGYQAAAGARAQAGVDQSNRMFGINNTDATGRFDVNNKYLTALAQLLDANGAAAMAQAGVQGATDNAAVLNNDITSRLANMNQPAQLVSSGLAIKNQQSASQYNDINNLLSSLGFFRQSQPGTPQVVTPQVGSVIGGGQTAGAAISSAGTGLAQYYQNQQLVNALKGLSNPGAGSPTSYSDFLKNNPSSMAAIGQ